MHKVKTVTKTYYTNNSFDDLTENEFNQNLAKIYEIYKKTCLDTDNQNNWALENIFLKQIERGNIYFLKWLHQNNYPITFNSNYNYETSLSLRNIKHNNILDIASASGQTHILDYLHDNNLIITKHSTENKVLFEYDVINKAVRNCQTSSLEWFYNHQEYHKFNYNPYFESEYGDCDCYEGEYEVEFDYIDFENVNCSEDKIVAMMNWYNTHYDCEGKLMCYRTPFVDAVCKYNYTKILDWLHNNPEYDFNYSHDGLIKSVSENRTDVLEWFHVHNNYYKINYKTILNFAIKNKLDNVIRWFEKIDIVFA